MTYKFSLLDLFGKAPVRSLNLFLFTAHVYSLFQHLVKKCGLLKLLLMIYMLCRLEVFLSWSIFTKAVAVLGGRLFNNFRFSRPGHVRKFPLLIAFRKVPGVGLKQHP